MTSVDVDADAGAIHSAVMHQSCKRCNYSHESQIINTGYSGCIDITMILPPFNAK